MKFKKTQKRNDKIKTQKRNNKVKTQKQLKYKKLNKLSKKQIGGLILDKPITRFDYDKILKFIEDLKTSKDRSLVISSFNNFSKDLTIKGKTYNVADEIVKFIKKNNAKNVKIEKNSFDTEIGKILLASVETSSVLNLSISMSNISSETYEIDNFIGSLRKNKTLKSLKLSFIKDYEILSKIINVIKDNKSIINLDFSNNSIFNNESLKILGEALITNKTIKTLNLFSNEITDFTIFSELIKDNTTLTNIIFNKPLPKKLLDFLSNNQKINLFNPHLSDITEEDLEKNKLLFEFLRKVYKFKKESNNIENNKSVFKSLKENVKKLLGDKYIDGLSIFDLEAINLCNDTDIDMKKSYFLFKENYEKAIEGYEKLKSLPIVSVSNSNNSNNTEKKNNIIVLSLHGVYDDLFKICQVPENITICYLSPDKYSTCINDFSFIKYLTEPNVIDNFLKDPSCLDKEKAGKFFSQSVLYYGGQYHVDLQLFRIKKSQGEHVIGLQILETNKETNTNTTTLKFNQFNLEASDDLIDLPNLAEDEWFGPLSELLEYFKGPKYQDKQFTIFITSCREFDNQYYNEGIANKTTFLEKTTQAINVLAQNQNEECKDIESCVKLFKECKNPITNIYMDNLHIINHVQITKKKINNRSSSLVKSNWDNKSLICFKSQIDIKKFLEDSIQDINGKICISLEAIKEKLERRYYIKLYSMLKDLISLKVEVYDIRSTFKNYNDLMMFIFDNNIDELLKYHLLTLFESIEYNSIEEIENNKKFLNFYINLNIGKLSNELILNNRIIFINAHLNFLNININNDKFKISKLDLSNNYSIRIYFSDPDDKKNFNFIKYLEEINLDNNKITQFPILLLKLQSLKLISLKGNKIEESTIPDEQRKNFNEGVWRRE